MLYTQHKNILCHYKCICTYVNAPTPRSGKQHNDYKCEVGSYDMSGKLESDKMIIWSLYICILRLETFK